MKWKPETFILLLTTIWLAACMQSSPTPESVEATTTPVVDGSAQGDFFIVENAQSAEGTYAVPPGEMVTLRWHITSGKKVYIKQTAQYGAGAKPAVGPLPSEGTLDVCPLPSITSFYLYVGGNPDKNTAVSYDLSLMTYMEIGLDQPIDLEAACWGNDGDYLLTTHGKALMNDMVLLLWSVRDVDMVTIMTSYGTEPVDHYGALPPSGMLAVCEQNEAAYTLHAGNKPPLQVTVSRANTAYYTSRQAYGECPYTGLVSWP